MNTINMTFETNLTKNEFASEIQRGIHHLEGVIWKINSSTNNMKVKDILTSVKANKHTYYNLDRKSIIMFKDLYSYLVKHKEKEVGGILIEHQLNTIITNIKYTGYLKKFKTMELIAHNIKH